MLIAKIVVMKNIPKVLRSILPNTLIFPIEATPANNVAKINGIAKTFSSRSNKATFCWIHNEIVFDL